MVQAPAPARIVEGGLPTEALIAHDILIHRLVNCRGSALPPFGDVRMTGAVVRNAFMADARTQMNKRPNRDASNQALENAQKAVSQLSAIRHMAENTGDMPLPLFVFTLLYGGMTCIAGVLGAKQLALGALAVEAGIFLSLVLVALSSAVAQAYGRDIADRLVPGALFRVWRWSSGISEWRHEACTIDTIASLRAEVPGSGRERGSKLPTDRHRSGSKDHHPMRHKSGDARSNEPPHAAVHR